MAKKHRSNCLIVRSSNSGKLPEVRKHELAQWITNRAPLIQLKRIHISPDYMFYSIQVKSKNAAADLKNAINFKIFKGIFVTASKKTSERKENTVVILRGKQGEVLKMDVEGLTIWMSKKLPNVQVKSSFTSSDRSYFSLHLKTNSQAREVVRVLDGSLLFGVTLSAKVKHFSF